MIPLRLPIAGLTARARSAGVCASAPRPSASLLARPFTARTTPDGRIRVTVAHGDGIGPEIMDATLRVLDKAGANLAYETITIGESVYNKGISSGIEDAGWKSLNDTRVFLKAPITTPLGGGVKSLNVTVRKTLGLYSNVRPVVSYHPFVQSLHPVIDMVVVRENEEDLYAGIEHRHTSEVVQCLKLITMPGSMKICRYAFEYARRHGRKKVTCITKNNIMKLTDGVFYKAFQTVAAQYPDIQSEHKIIDIATAQVATKPGQFDVIVTLNLYGDILSDVAADVAGSVGLAGSANIGDHYAMFEAVHGSAPDIAGKNIANPSGLLNGAVMMLLHVGQREVARKVKNALLRTIEDGLHTADIYRGDTGTLSFSKVKVGTREFADAVIDRLGSEPQVLRAEARKRSTWPEEPERPTFVVPEVPVQHIPVKSLIGVDIFVDWDKEMRNPDVLAKPLEYAAAKLGLKLQMISNRGVKVWPNGHPETYKVNHWRCRFVGTAKSKPESSGSESKSQSAKAFHGVEMDVIPRLMTLLHDHKIEVIKTENLYLFDGQPGFSMGQGQ